MPPAPRRVALALLAALPLMLYVVYPVGAMLADGLSAPVADYRARRLGWDPVAPPFAAGVRAAWQDPLVARATWGTLTLSFWTVVLGGAWGLGLALLWQRRAFPGRRFFALLGYAPLLMPPLVGTLAFFRLLGHSGLVWQWLPFAGGKPWLEPFGAVLVLHAYSFGLYTYAFAAAALQDLDPALEEAARGLGASRSRTFVAAIWPALRGPVGAAALLAFMAAGASFSGPYLLDTDGHYLTVEILNLQESGDRGLTAAVTAWLALLSLLALPGFLAFRAALPSGGAATAGLKGTSRAALVPARGSEAWLRFALSLAAAAVLLIPLGVVVLSAVSGRAGWHEQGWEVPFSTEAFAGLDGRDWSALGRSLAYGACAAALNIAVALGLALALRRAPAWSALPAEAAVMLAVALPGSAVAIALLSAFHGPSWLFGGAALGQSATLLVLAYTIRNLPLAVRPVRAALDGLGEDLEAAARGLGTEPLRALLRVTIPLLLPTLAAAALLCFVAAAGEYVASELLWSVHTQPVSVRIREVYRSNFPRGAALSLVLMLLCAAATVAAAWAGGKGKLRIQNSK
ncbi:MAG: iron ABC transporter permease [Planctomycetes bacterium]|nr:iron ABC transporter permease [Planctomycetota bacterium]